MKTILSFIFLTFLILSTPALAEKSYKPCGISLKSFSTTRAAPGDTFEMYGKWGAEQGVKLPCINKGGQNRLEVLAWSDSVLKVRVPAHLASGDYKVGVYCNDLSLGGSYSSGWRSFKVTGNIFESPKSTSPKSAKSTASKSQTSKKASQPKKSSFPASFNFDALDLKFGDFGMNEIVIGIVAALGLFVLIVLITRGRQPASHYDYSEYQTHRTTAGPSATDSPTGTPFSEQAPEAERPEWKSTFMGVKYRVESYDGETMTVAIDVPKILPYQAEIDARDGRPTDVDPRLVSNVGLLLDLGANYIDISYNTNRVAAEVPFDSATVDKRLAEKIVGLLIRLRDAAV
ncbi:hypothetical protein OAO01_06860 [Oligoflexia bacterium]|nr:hypothetical protein [Oligoflexia bacterium]